MLKHEKQSHWPLCSQLLVQKSAAAHSLLQTDCCVHCCRWCGVHLSVPGGFSFRLFAGSQLHEGAWARGHLDTLAGTARWQGTQGAAGNGQSPQLLMLLECVVVLLRAVCWSWVFLFLRADSLRAAEVHMLWHQICAALSTTCSGEWSQEGQSLLSLISHGEIERMVSTAISRCSCELCLSLAKPHRGHVYRGQCWAHSPCDAHSASLWGKIASVFFSIRWSALIWTTRALWAFSPALWLPRGEEAEWKGSALTRAAPYCWSRWPWPWGRRPSLWVSLAGVPHNMGTVSRWTHVLLRTGTTSPPLSPRAPVSVCSVQGTWARK